jgi:hypothetical protein
MSMGRHVAADYGEIGFACRHFVNKPPFENDYNAVGEPEQLIEIFADQQHGRAAVANGDDLRVNLRRRREIEPETWVRR